ncbi:MAG TPA: TMEM175 family protein [Gaiellaceae bacterium]|nr:TMEM175 family protein [Gaiellaceae bacterium]
MPAEEFDDLWSAILHEWPAYLGYATSFLTIGGIWLAHHGVFRRLRYANNRVMQINLLLLMAVSFLPFPTSLVAEAIRDQSAERAAAIFYGLSLLAIAVLFSALWATVARDRELLRPEVSDDEVNALLLASSPSIGFYGGTIALAIVAPRAAAFAYLLIAILAIARVRGDEPA